MSFSSKLSTIKLDWIDKVATGAAGSSKCLSAHSLTRSIPVNQLWIQASLPSSRG
jgi:hypothetical protein